MEGVTCLDGEEARGREMIVGFRKIRKWLVLESFSVYMYKESEREERDARR
jgi:hypothetical protein